MKLGNYNFDKPLILAPMAGVTDIAFREFCYDLGADFAVSELIMSKSLEFKSEKGFKLLKKGEKDNPFIVQLGGDSVETFLKGGEIASKNGAEILDLNMGCPVKKVTKTGAGSALIKDPEKVYKIVSTLVENFDIPITVKIRLGWDCNSLTYREVLDSIQKGGAEMVAVHRRTRSQMYGPIFEPEIFKEIRELVSIPLIYNGDVFTSDDIDLMFQLGADGVMIGRGAIKNPWIFSRKDIVPIEERYKGLLKLFDLNLKHHDEREAVNLMKRHYNGYIKGGKKGRALKNLLMRSDNYSEIMGLLKQFFDKLGKLQS